MAKVQHLPLAQVKKKQYVYLSSTRLHVVFILTLWAAVPTAYSLCNNGQFACKDGSCILQEKMCDGRLDCVDGSDEVECDSKMCRKPLWFKCFQPNAPCLSSDLICNGVENCPSGEDEHDCVGRKAGGEGETTSSVGDVGTGGWHSRGRNCSEFEYTCQTDKTCIPLNLMCDGHSDCQDNSDELAGCIKAQASCSGFFCTNKKCLESAAFACDGMDDCGDGSDEKHCSGHCKPEMRKFLCSDNTTCLNYLKVCDGVKDCTDGSDEANPGICSETKEGCKWGYERSKLNSSCIDINECQELHDICSQDCRNYLGGYRCTCDVGYILRPDNRTCEAQGGEEPLLLYSTQTTVMGVHLRSKRVFTVAKNLSKVIGVSYDGDHIYWTNLQNEAESIVRSRPDGTQQEILLTSGLDAPEDLAIDWLTGNIYFSDNVMHHIAVCSNDGIYCTVLRTADVHHPRGVALWPQRGQIFWTDWGIKPMIVRASMDGNNMVPLVKEDIHWPNGIALDMHNNRLYWVDAKLGTIETIRPDGTDRRMILKDILKHPYGLAIFENQLYWSDWGTRSVHTCNKFTGKNHHVLTKDRTIYAVHIYHSAKQPKTPHGCQQSRCSHLCLLSETERGFSCACPDGWHLSADQLHCVKMQKQQRLFIGVKSTLLEMEHTTFGRHVISVAHPLPLYINEMAYNSVNGSVFLADNVQRAIYEYDLASSQLFTLTSGNLGNVTGLAFDHLAHTLYWTDSEFKVVVAFSLKTHSRAIVRFFAGIEVPFGISVVPADGVMFVGLRSRRNVHIDQLPLSGLGAQVHGIEDDLGDDDIKFASDFGSKTIYWSDSDLGRISFSDYRNLHAYTFRGRLRRPYSLAIVDEDVFWSELKSSSLHWTHKSNLGPIKRVELQATRDMYSQTLPDRIPLAASSSAIIADHPCQHANGGCSHVCVTQTRYAGVCLCPAGLVYKDASNRTCIEVLDCEFRCRSGECLTQSRRCNGHKDCPDASDEEGCEAGKPKQSKIVCTVGKYMCHNQERCIEQSQRCDGQKDCNDNSDEEHCDRFDKSKQCHSHQHACDNGHCVDFSVMCDGANDCGDNSDENNCKLEDGKDSIGARLTCDKSMFQCNSGTCIAKSWECDGKPDCPDGSDEHDKCNLKECPTNMHKCLLGQCIDGRLVCDGYNDCGDRSDELNCDLATGQKRNMSCGNMFQCSSDPQICLEQSAKCNGTAECPRGEDEADCNEMCSIYEFQCQSNKQCIRMEFRCDHDRDCPDGSDENNCQGVAVNGSRTDVWQTHERICEAHMYDCRDGGCVDMSRVCDGFPDCENGADEDGSCRAACKSTTGKSLCDHKCFPTPMGAVCSCFQGYKLNLDQRTCDDINECVEYDPCAQLCENTHGSYRCSCYADFMLRTDKTTCKSIESEAALMFSTYDEVRSMTEMPIMLRVAWSANETKISGFDLNIHKRRAYFSTETEDIIYMVDMESNTIKAGLTMRMPSKIAVDWVTDNIYVISRSLQYEIKICSFSAKMCGRIVQTNPRETMRTLAVDAYNRKLFYVTTRAHTFGPPLSMITVANLDGSKREQLLSKSGLITAISTDPHKKLVYYADSHTKTLQAISYQLGGSRTPITILQKSTAIAHPSGLSIYENQAFIVNIGSKEAVRCALFGLRHCKAYNLNILNAEDIVVDGASRQPVNANPCIMAKCKGICLQAEYGYECMCGDAIVSEHVVCPKETNNFITSSPAMVDSSQIEAELESTSSHAAAAILLSLLFIALLGATVGYMYYRRVKPGHRDFNINLHFQNPISSTARNGKPAATTNGGNSCSSTLASFEAKREKLQFSAPIYRFLRRSTSNSNSEILLESPSHRAVHALAQHTRMSDLLAAEEDGASHGHVSAPGNGHYDDDARTRLVP